MSSIRSIVELGINKFYEGVEQVIIRSIPQINSDVSTYLATDSTVNSHFGRLQPSLGSFVDGMQRQIIERVVNSSTERCKEHLIGGEIKRKCIRACLTDCDIEVPNGKEDDHACIIQDLEKDIASRDETIHALKV